MAKKNLKDIHPLIPILCEAVVKNNDCIIEHLNRTKINDHKYIDKFQDRVLNSLKQQYDYKWGKEIKANGIKEKDSIDIMGDSKNERCIIEIDATRIDQIAQKFVSRICLWGFTTKRRLLYIALLYKGSDSHSRKEDCEKYIRYCNKIIKKSKDINSTVIGIYTDGDNIEVWDYNISSSFLITYPNRIISSNSMVEVAKDVIDWYVKNKPVKNFDDIEKVFGKFVSKVSCASKNEIVKTSIGNIYVSKDWREYGQRAYWNEFINLCKKLDIIIEKQVIKYKPDDDNKFVYENREL